MHDNFFLAIKELLDLDKSYSIKLDVLLLNYEGYENFISPHDYELFKITMEYYKKLPKNLFTDLVCNSNSSEEEIIRFFQAVTDVFNKKLAPNILYFSSASIVKDCTAIIDAIVPASVKNPQLPKLENELAAPFQTMLRFKSLLDQIYSLVPANLSHIKSAAKECNASIKKLSDEMNSLNLGIEKIEESFKKINQDYLADHEIGQSILGQKIRKETIELLFLLKNNELVKLNSWLKNHFLPLIYKESNHDVEERSRYLECFLTAIGILFSGDELTKLNNVIGELSSSSTDTDVYVTDEFKMVAEKLSLAASDATKSNVHFLRFMKGLFAVAKHNSSANFADENSFPTLDELISLIELNQELAGQEQERANSVSEQRRLQSTMFEGSILHNTDGRVTQYMLRTDDVRTSAGDMTRENDEKITLLKFKIRELDIDIAKLKSQIAPIQEKKDNLVDYHKDKSYREKFPLHYAVRQNNLAEVAKLLLSENAAKHNSPDGAGYSPIYHAFEKRHAEIFQLLYEGVNTTPEERQKYKELSIKTYKQLKSKREKGTINKAELGMIESYREMALLFKDPYHKLWNNLDPSLQENSARDAQRVINIFQDYHAPAVFSFLSTPMLQRILTVHMFRNHLEKAKDLVKEFKNYLILLDAPENQLGDRASWSIEKGIYKLKEKTESLPLLRSYNPEGEFASRLTYVFTQLELLKLHKPLTPPVSDSNLESASGKNRSSNSHLFFNRETSITRTVESSINTISSEEPEKSSNCNIS